MKHFILGLTFSTVSSLPILAGPLVGGGGGVQLNVQSNEKNVIILEASQISDVRLKDENVVHFKKLLQSSNHFHVQNISKQLYKIDLSTKSGIADIQLIDGTIIRGDMGGGGSL